jgi:hypothetical protein
VGGSQASEGLLGGTHEEGVWTLDPDPIAAERIMQGHMKVFREMA